MKKATVVFVALLAISVILFSTLTASPLYKVVIHNHLDQAIYYWIDWIDHPWRDNPEWGPGPINIAGGEIDPKSKVEAHSGLPKGDFILTAAPTAPHDELELQPVIFQIFDLPDGSIVHLHIEKE